MKTDATDVVLSPKFLNAVMQQLQQTGFWLGFGFGKSSWGANWQECLNSKNVGWGSSLVVEASLCYWALHSKRLILKETFDLPLRPLSLHLAV